MPLNPWNGNGFIKWIPLLALIGAFIFGYGVTQEKVANLSKQQDALVEQVSKEFEKDRLTQQTARQEVRDDIKELRALIIDALTKRPGDGP